MVCVQHCVSFACTGSAVRQLGPPLSYLIWDTEAPNQGRELHTASWPKDIVYCFICLMGDAFLLFLFLQLHFDFTGSLTYDSFLDKSICRLGDNCGVKELGAWLRLLNLYAVVHSAESQLNIWLLETSSCLLCFYNQCPRWSCLYLKKTTDQKTSRYCPFKRFYLWEEGGISWPVNRPHRTIVSGCLVA
jgi:hypothetical protein